MKRLTNVGLLVYLQKNCLNINFLWLTLTAVGLGIFMVAMPKIQDDWWFMFHLRTWFAQQPDANPFTGGNIFRYGIPWKELRDTFIEHYYHDNIRLCNICGMFLLIFPKWVGSSVAALSWAYAMWGSLKFAGIDWRKSALVPLAIFLWIFGLEWRDYMGGLIFQLNYVVGSGLSIFLLNMLRKKCNGRWRKTGLFLLGLIVGAWHEGFGITLLGGLVAILIFCKDINRKEIYVVLAGLLLGTVWIMLCPNFYGRIRTEHAKKHLSFLMGLMRTCKWHYPIFIFLLMVLIRWIKLGFKWLISNPLIVFTIVSSFASIFLALSVGSLRVAWMGDFFAIPAILYLFREFFPNFWKSYRGWSLMIGLALMTFSIWTLALVDIYTLRYKPIFEDIMLRYGRGEGPKFFADIMPEDQRPYLTSLMLINRYFLEPYREIEFYGRDYNEDGLKRIFPKQLYSFDYNCLPKVPGNSGLREIDGILIEPYRRHPDDLAHFSIDFGPLKHRPIGANLYKFTNSHDGKEYEMVTLYEGRFYKALFGINRIDTIPD